MKIDLHIHTNNSDGALTPIQVIDEASLNGVEIIAIADHDTIAAYNKELFDYAKEKNIKLIPAVEISTKINKCGIHVLGYNIDINNVEFLKKLSLIRNSRHDYLYKVSRKLEELGYTINYNELNKIDAVTKAHIALDIVTNPKNNEILLKQFDKIPDKGMFIETIMNEGCPAYVKKETVTPKEAADLIRKANGKVVLAHPVAYEYEDNLSENEILNIISDMKADGIEAIYIYIDRNHNKINEINKWTKIAKELNVFVTIGSDFHNYDSIHSLIGLTNENLEINEDIEKNGLLNKLQIK